MDNWERKKKNRKEVLSQIAKKEGIKFKELVEDVELSRTTVNRIIKDLTEAGRIMTKRDETDKRIKRYYLTENEIENPEIQAEIVFQLLFHKILSLTYSERDTIYRELKDKDEKELKQRLEEKIITPFVQNSEIELIEIDDPQDLAKELIEKKVVGINFEELDETNDELNGVIKQAGESDPIGFIEECLGTQTDTEKVSREELMKEFKLSYLSQGPLLIPKIVFTANLIIQELLNIMVHTEEYEKKIILKKNIRYFTNLVQSHYLPEEIDEDKQDEILDYLEKIVSLEATERYEKYFGGEFTLDIGGEKAGMALDKPDIDLAKSIIKERSELVKDLNWMGFDFFYFNHILFLRIELWLRSLE